jgi:hypothetical protein
MMRSVAVSWYMNQNKALLGQDKDFVKNCRIFIDREQPLIPATLIKENEVKRQENKLKELRKKLQQALDDYENFDSLLVEDVKTEKQNEPKDEPSVNNLVHAEESGDLIKIEEEEAEMVIDGANEEDVKPVELIA